MSRSISITQNSRLAWSLREAAEALGVSERFLRNEIRRGKLCAIKRGRRVLVRAETLDLYLRDDSHKETATTV
jgi:excisionase family DNA binding protein